jgi:hypothetical protein
MGTNNMTGKFTWRFIAGLVSVLAWAASAAAQTVVAGTGNPNIDVPAVQAAVNQGGEVVLRGHFSFDRPPTIVLPPVFQENGYPPAAMVLVSKAVSISGAPDGEMTSIEAGTIPFYVEAPGAPVSIQGLRFLRPKEGAVLVYAVSGLVIASCKIEGVEPWPNLEGTGIEIDTSGGPFNPGKPENVSGTISIVNNDIDMAGGTASDITLGVFIFYVGVPGAEVQAYLSGNRIRNFTERAIEIRGIGGRTFIEGNVIATGTIAGPNGVAFHPIFVQDGSVLVPTLNSYLIAHNSVDVQWPTGSAAGITVRGAISHAIVVDNDVNMEASEGTVFDFRSAGIEITGSCHDDVVQGNRIRGHARAALSVGQLTAGVPANIAFVLNHLDDFKASLADIFVGGGIMNTFVVGQGTVEDHGIGTVIVPVAGR